jgi:pimeloyl-ACP methyl ester carboxylesterase
MLGIKRITGAAGSAPGGEPGSWVSDAAREKFTAAYERAFALWPQPCEEFDVETATATTRVHAYRPHPGGEPVVLLTGAGLASMTPMPLRRRLARWLDSPAMLQPELMTLMWAAIRGYRAEPKFPGVLTDDELRAIDVPVLLITGARSALLTPAEARARGSLMPHAEVAIVPGSHGGFNRIDELNDRIAAFIKAHATEKQAAQPARPPASEQ